MDSRVNTSTQSSITRQRNDPVVIDLVDDPLSPLSPPHILNLYNNIASDGNDGFPTSASTGTSGNSTTPTASITPVPPSDTMTRSTSISSAPSSPSSISTESRPVSHSASRSLNLPSIMEQPRTDSSQDSIDPLITSSISNETSHTNTQPSNSSSDYQFNLIDMLSRRSSNTEWIPIFDDDDEVIAVPSRPWIQSRQRDHTTNRSSNESSNSSNQFTNGRSNSRSNSISNNVSNNQSSSFSNPFSSSYRSNPFNNSNTNRNRLNSNGRRYNQSRPDITDHISYLNYHREQSSYPTYYSDSNRYMPSNRFNRMNYSQPIRPPSREETIEEIFARLQAEEEAERQQLQMELSESRRSPFFLTSMFLHISDPMLYDPQLLAISLSNRDFDESDYELLLRLDETIPKKTVDKESLSLLEKRPLKEDELKKDDLCSVCLDEFPKEEDVTILPCKHFFHPDCIQTWLEKYGHVCPVCKSSVADMVQKESNKRKRGQVIDLADSDDDILSEKPSKVPRYETEE